MFTRPEVIAQKISEWQQRGYHVLSPATRVWAFAPGYGVNVALIKLDAAIDDNGFGRDTYYDKNTMKPTERAINAVGLSRISQAAGIVWHPQLTTRTDDRRILHYWEFRAVAILQTYDGTWLNLSATKEIDLRDGSAQIGGWTPERWDALIQRNASATNDKKEWTIAGWSEKRVLQTRVNGLRLAETKAKNAAIRSIGLRHKYSVEELEQPFVVLRASYIPDLADPRVRQLVAERAMAGTSALFSMVRVQALPGYVEHEPDPVIDVDPSDCLPTYVSPAVPAVAPVCPTQGVTPTPPAPAHKPANECAKPDVAPRAAAPSKAPAETPAKTATAAEANHPEPSALPSGARFVVACRIAKTGTSAKGDWTMFEVEFSDKVKATTFSESMSGTATEAQHKNQPVTITTEAGKYGPVLKSITLVDTRQTALFGDKGASTQPAAVSAAANDDPF